MSDADKIRYGWPVLALVLAAIGLLLALYEGGGSLTPALIPAGLLGYALGRRASVKDALAGFRNPRSTGIAVAVGLVVAALLAPALVGAGPLGAIIVPAIGFVGAGYLWALRSRRDLMNSIEHPPS